MENKASGADIASPHTSDKMDKSPPAFMAGRRTFLGGVALFAAAAAAPKKLLAHMPPAPTTPVAFTNLQLFDGTRMSSGRTVLVQGNLIADILSASPGLPEGTQLIDCGGRTLMPGMIDAHWHAMGAGMGRERVDRTSADVGYVNFVAGEEAERTLMRGFTGVRDLGGSTFGLKRAIDEGIVAGPRIWPSGKPIGQTSGHSDNRSLQQMLRDIDGSHSYAVADGVDEVLRMTREQLMQGASQIKVMAGGGMASDFDPIDSSQYTETELRAAVEAAASWNTYVTVHAYTPHSIQAAIRAGVKCIDHGQLIDEDTARMIADRDIWLSIQPFLNNEYSIRERTPDRIAKQNTVHVGTDRAYNLAKTYKLKTAFGTDLGGGPEKTRTQGAIMGTLTRWYAPREILSMATKANGELCALSGHRNPYPGKLGVIEKGAYADMLLVDGDPTANIGLLAAPDTTLQIIMKDGRIYKNRLGSAQGA